MSKTLDLTFHEFKEWIMPKFAATFSPRDTNFINMNAYTEYGDLMLTHYEYGTKQEQFLIQNTKIFIRGCLDREQSHNTSTAFLEKLSNKIAAYFSYYIMYKYEIPESGKSKNKLRMRVQAEIKEVIFDKNPYIAQLKTKQAQNRAFRQKTKSERKKILKEKRHDSAASAYRESQQIRSMFIDAQNTPRIKR